MAKRIISLLVAVMMVLAIVPAAAFAKTEAPAPVKTELDDALNVEGGTLVFTSEGEYPWTAVSVDDRVYAQSGNAGVNSTDSALTMTAAVEANMAIHFDYKAWGEGTSTVWDKCIFKIDDTEIFKYGALDNDWTEYVINVAAGEHTFTWIYSKDGTTHPTGDYFAIDNVRFEEREPLPINEELDAAMNAEGGSIHFYSSGDYPWIVVEDEESGRVYGQSGNAGVNSSVSEVTATVTLERAGTVSFEFKAWGEGTSTFYDHCDFTIDGERVLYYGAYDNEDWELVSYELTAGEHELKWSYTKDGSVSKEGDYFAVDNVTAAETPIEITSIEISGVTLPRYGEVNDNDIIIPEDCGYHIVRCFWFIGSDILNEGDTFDSPDGYYIQQYVFAPDGNNYFAPADELTVTINGDASLVRECHYSEELEQLFVQTIYLRVERDPITEAEINGIVPPVNGMTAGEVIANAAVPEGAHYSISTIRVYCNGFQDPLAEDAVLEANGETDDYYVVIELAPAPGYTFVEDYTATVNGGEIGVEYAWYYSSTGGARIKTVNMTIVPDAPQVIDTIEINGFVVPEYGANSLVTVTVPEDAHYSIALSDTYWDWYVPGGGVGMMTDTDVFDDPEAQYHLYLTIIPEDGWTVAEDFTVTINGGTEYVDMFGYHGGSMPYIYVNTICFQVEEPAESDLDRALNIEGGELHFDTTETYPWITVDDGERFYAQSGNAGVSSSSSSLTTTVTLEAGSVITFDFKAWGEGSSSFWDHCDFYVNNTRVLYYGAYDNEWETFTYAVPEAGEYTLTWVYTKDSSVNPNGDYFAVDNVCIGEPILPETINVDDVTVEEGRYAAVVYEILPEDATDTSVTFTIEDTSIATVDEDGLVHGVAVGETTITVTSVSNPEVFGTATVTVTEAGPAVALYGFGCYDIGGTNTGKWVTFTDVDPGTVTALSEMDNTYAAAYYNGCIYGYRQSDGQFYKVNAETFEVEYLSLAINDTALDMAYNYADHTMYLLAQREEGGSYPIYLMTVDLETGEATDVGMVSGVNSGSLLTLAIDGEGNAYGLAAGSDAVLYSVDLATGGCTEIGATGIGMNYIQSMHWDMNTGRLFWAQIYSTSSNGLYEIDPETGAAEFLGVIGTSGMEITGLYTIYDEGGEPEPIDLIEINDFVVPEWGANPFYGVTIPEDAGYAMIQRVWYRFNVSSPLNPDDTFDDPNEEYYMYFFFVPTEGNTFADEVTVLINGSEELVYYVSYYNGGISVYTNYFTVEEPVTGILGDVDLDGNVEAEDALLAMRYAMGLIELTDEQLAQLDVNGDGVYDLVDAVLILRYAMGLIDQFPIELE